METVEQMMQRDPVQEGEEKSRPMQIHRREHIDQLMEPMKEKSQEEILQTMRNVLDSILQAETYQDPLLKSKVGLVSGMNNRVTLKLRTTFEQ